MGTTLADLTTRWIPCLLSSLVFLRDGSACGQADAAERVALDPSLLYMTRDEAVREGLARLRVADAINRS